MPQRCRSASHDRARVRVTHLPFIAGSYGFALVVIGGYAVAATLRLGRARRRLRALDPRSARAAARSA